MKGRSLVALAVAWSTIGSARALAWGTRVTHWSLTQASFDRNSEVDAFLRDVYGLRDGINSRFAVQLGFGPEELDQDLGPDPSDDSRPIDASRFVRSWNEVEEGWGLIPGLGEFPLAPAEARLELAERCYDYDGAGPDPCFDSLPRQSVVHLLRSGSYAEDNPNLRAAHHFHDPVKEHGWDEGGLYPEDNRGLDNDDAATLVWISGWAAERFRGGGDFRALGRSARDRALDHASDGASFPSSNEPRNLFSLAHAERYLYRAVTAWRQDEREHFMAVHFLALGSVLHLLQDMTQPAHVRNDFFPDHVVPAVIPEFLGGAGIEDVGDQRLVARLVSRFGAPSTDLSRSLPFARVPLAVRGPFTPLLPLLPPEGIDAHDFWNQLTILVNRRFFSRGSVDDDGSHFLGYSAPAVPDCSADGLEDGGTGSARTFTITLPERELLSGAVRSSEARFIASELVPHLARCRYHALPVPGTVLGAAWWAGTVIDESVQRDYLELLWPLAVDASEKFLRFYLSPRLEVVPAGTSPGDAHRFRLGNPSALPLQFLRDNVKVFYQDAGGHRWEGRAVCHTTEIVELPPGAVGPFECELLPPSGAEPASGTDFVVVVRGRHGDRGRVATSEDYDSEAAPYVVAVDQVRSTILYDHVEGENEGVPPSTDVPRKHDLYAVQTDATRALGDADPGPTPRNLTGPVREALGRGDLDFAAPAANVLGGVALRADRDSPSGSSETFADIQAPLDLFLLPPGEEPTPSAIGQPVLGSRIDEVRFEGNLVPRWVPDGSALFFYADASEDDLAPEVDQLNRIQFPSGASELFIERRQDGRGRAFVGSIQTPAEELPLGTERETCEMSEEPNMLIVGPISSDRMVVTARCQTERVVSDGGKRWAQASVGPVYTLRVMNIVPSADEAGKLDGTFTHRFEVSGDHGQVVACGSPSAPCHERGAASLDAIVRDFAPIASPDGSRVAFLHDASFLEFTDQVALYVADLGSGEIRKLASLSPGLDNLLAATLTWSPDGRALAFALADTRDVYVLAVNADSPQEPKRLTRDAGVAMSLGWIAPLRIPSAP